MGEDKGGGWVKRRYEVRLVFEEGTVGPVKVEVRELGEKQLRLSIREALELADRIRRVHERVRG